MSKPSGVCQVRSRSLTSFAASACQSSISAILPALEFRLAFLKEPHRPCHSILRIARLPLAYCLLMQRRCIVRLQRADDILAHLAKRQRWPTSQPPRKRACLVNERIIADAFVDQPPSFGLQRRNFLAQHHHFGGARLADQARQRPACPAIGDQPDIDKGLEEITALARDAEIGRQRDRTADTRRRAL